MILLLLPIFLKGIMVDCQESDFGTMFQQFLQNPNVARVLEKGKRVIEEDQRRAEEERVRLSYLNNPPDCPGQQ